jgi:hypothetical protein
VHEVSAPGGVVVDEVAVRQLGYLSRILEAHFTQVLRRPAPQDIEWLVKGGAVHVVQSRPYLVGN